jgi:hypothetical protein
MDPVDLQRIRHTVATELPVRVRWLILGTPLDFDFSRATRPLTRLSKDEVQGSLEPEWQDIFVFGEQSVAEGGGATPFIGVHGTSGTIRGIDLEREGESTYLINSSIESYIATFRLLDRALRLASIPLEDVSIQAATIDPSAFPISEWRHLLDYLGGT